MPTRRKILAWSAATLLTAVPLRASPVLRLGLTPVFLDNDATVVARLRDGLSTTEGGTIEVAQRRTYEEVTGLLLEGSVDAAWLCGFPYIQHRSELDLLAVPVWRGRSYYRSYRIVARDDPASGLADLEGGTHAFSDPDSNSGWLVTASDLARLGRRPDEFFARTIFCYGHRNVVRAVAGGLTRSGSVDGYVWEALTAVEPQLTERTRVVERSEWLGFPPFVTRADRASDPRIMALRDALLRMGEGPAGREALALLQLDGMTQAPPDLYDDIRRRMQDLSGTR